MNERSFYVCIFDLKGNYYEDGVIDDELRYIY